MCLLFLEEEIKTTRSSLDSFSKGPFCCAAEDAQDAAGIMDSLGPPGVHGSHQRIHTAVHKALPSAVQRRPRNILLSQIEEVRWCGSDRDNPCSLTFT